MKEFAPLIPDRERFEYSVSKRKELEYQLREAEILLGLIKKHLVNADAILVAVEPRLVTVDIEKVTAALPIPVVQEVDKSRVKVTRELDQLILDTWKNGSVHISDVAKRLNASFSTVRNRLIELGAFKPKPIMTEKDRATVVKLFDERVSLEEISSSLSPSRSVTHIKRLLQQAGRLHRNGYADRRDQTLRRS